LLRFRDVPEQTSRATGQAGPTFPLTHRHTKIDIEQADRPAARARRLSARLSAALAARTAVSEQAALKANAPFEWRRCDVNRCHVYDLRSSIWPPLILRLVPAVREAEVRLAAQNDGGSAILPERHACGTESPESLCFDKEGAGTSWI
jgi:hypothetical protein